MHVFITIILITIHYVCRRGNSTHTPLLTQLMPKKRKPLIDIDNIYTHTHTHTDYSEYWDVSGAIVLPMLTKFKIEY